MAPQNVICIDLTTTTDDEKDDDGKISAAAAAAASSNSNSNNKRSSSSPQGLFSAAASNKKRCIKQEKSSMFSSYAFNDSDDDDDDEIEILEGDAIPTDFTVEETPPHAAAASRSNSNDDDADELVVVGTKHRDRLPHARHQCTEKPFQSDTGYTLQARRAVNEQHCDLCYCFVCDCKVADCQGDWKNNHCLATDSGPNKEVWEEARRAMRRRNNNNNNDDATTSTAAAASHAVALETIQAMSRTHPAPTARRRRRHHHHRSHRRRFSSSMTELLRAARQNIDNHNSHHSATAASTFDSAAASHLGTGPWAPDDPTVAVLRDKSLTQCRHCNWMNRFKHRNFSRPNNLNPTGCQDWCGACGRVASARDLGKQQGKAYVVQQSADLDLGVREIPFRVQIPDVRQMTQFKERWNQNNWAYSEIDQQDEFVQHRLGTRPTLAMILSSIPILPPEKLPTDGNASRATHLPVSADETQAILLDSPQRDLELLRLLHEIDATFGSNPVGLTVKPVPHDWLSGQVECTWNRPARRGVLRVRVWLRSIPSMRYRHSSPSAMTAFLGTWFGVGPFQLADLINLRATAAPEARRSYSSYSPMGRKIPVPPFTLSRAAYETAHETAKQEQEVLVDLFNEAVDENRLARYSLTSGTGSSVLGGICTNETDFEGMLRRFYREILFECAEYVRPLSCWHSSETGVVSNHRTMRELCDTNITTTLYLGRYDNNPNYALGGCFSQEDKAMLALTRKDAHTLKNETRSLGGMLSLLESRGHPEAPFVNGLEIELLPFQLQSLQWAIERETTPGGIQSYFWSKLPNVAAPNQDVYYNPILGKLSTSKPSLVRGGFLCESMGLGKTIITLALILANPAPLEPAPGSHASTITAQPNLAPGTFYRDPDLYQRNAELKPKRGSIVSRGTLVVCSVSLVGQWIEEAKSKLSDPGLIYSYHGSNRTRDPKILAKKQIIVTTYETLASDATYHAKKSNDENYTPPCEMVRFYRIVCDEAHQMRNGSNKVDSVFNLQADNRWLVSGTPVNTKVSDLQNQFKFLQLENVSDYMSLFRASFFAHVKSPENGRRSHDAAIPGLGMFSFFMRSLMMRHTQAQMYAGTDTTLMSLPPMTERLLTVQFTEEEKVEYSKMEGAARQFYLNLKASMKKKSGRIGKHYLALMQKLTPLRIACAGGKLPLDDGVKIPEEERGGDDDDDDDSEGDSDSDDDEHEEKRNKKIQKYSKFAFTSKLAALIRELESIREKDKTAKCLVFSQFNSTLDWLKEELPLHGFSYRTLSGQMTMSQRAKALRDFQNDPPTTLFLLSMRSGAVGINLTQASNCFIMEPCFNPALVQQAIGRVYRLGQQQSVTIFRLVAEDTVESRMQQMLENKYGSSQIIERFGKSGENAVDGNDGDGDKKPAAKKKSSTEVSLVGSIATDKATVVENEYDLLFGLQQPEAAAPPAADAAAASDDSADDTDQQSASGGDSNDTLWI